MSYVITPTGDSSMTLRLAKPIQYIKRETGFFLTITERTETIYYARLTGRTARKWGFDCPTMELYSVDTTAQGDGSIWGVRGARLAGTWLVRPEALPDILDQYIG